MGEKMVGYNAHSSYLSKCTRKALMSYFFSFKHLQKGRPKRGEKERPGAKNLK
jgi:hypothetical protein